MPATRMPRPMFTARAASPFSHAFRFQPRRAFATPPVKDTSPPSPIERSKEQAHPIGPYYESILKQPQPIPAQKPEDPPSTSPNAPRSESPESAPTPAKRGRKPKEPKDDNAKPIKSTISSNSTVPPVAGITSTTTIISSTTGATSSASASAPSSSPQHASQIDEASNPNSVQGRARVVFGSRLAGPAERAERVAAMRARSRLVAGVLVPPRPEEPDNCCMSGCVNCVWDRYRDEMETWASATAEAERRLRAQEAGARGVAQGVSAQPALNLGQHDVDERGAVSMDDDGGGSATNWDLGGVRADKITKDLWDDELYKNVPVGIREFMKQEKRLREKHAREGTLGG